LRRRRLPVVLCVDVEPDTREIELGEQAWLGFERLLERLPELRRRLGVLVRGGVRISWFVRADPQVEIVHGSAGWAFERFATELETLRRAGDEIALHVHAWRRDKDGWLVDHGDAQWVTRCVLTGLEAYRSAFGSAPASYRGGDRFITGEVVAMLESAGVSADVTLEPRMPPAAGLTSYERTTGALPDYTRAPTRVYRASREDFLRPSEPARHLTMIPLTPGGPETLYPWMHPPQFAERLFDRVREPDLTHLAFALRSDLALNDREWEQMLANLEIVPHVLASAADRRMCFVRAEELARAQSRRIGSRRR